MATIQCGKCNNITKAKNKSRQNALEGLETGTNFLDNTTF